MEASHLKLRNCGGETEVPVFHRLTYLFISFCAVEISEDEDSDGSEEDLEDTNHVGDQNGGQPPQAKKLRR